MNIFFCQRADSEGFHMLENSIEEAAKAEAKGAEKLLEELQIPVRLSLFIYQKQIICL